MLDPFHELHLGSNFFIWQSRGFDCRSDALVVSDIDDADSAYRAAQKKANSLLSTDYQDFRRRLGEYLKRRGFSYSVIIKTIEHLWQEREKPQTAELFNAKIIK